MSTWADYMARYFDAEPSDAEMEDGVAHHGPRILTRRDLGVCLAVERWIRTVREQGGWYGKEWLPTAVDFEKSRLFWRIRSGKDPLPHRPPTAYSCPWYELIDEPERPHWAYDMTMHRGKAHVAQCAYEVLEMDDTNQPKRLKFGPWQFRCWHGEGPYNNGVKGWWIQVDQPGADGD